MESTCKVPRRRTVNGTVRRGVTLLMLALALIRLVEANSDLSAWANGLFWPGGDGFGGVAGGGDFGDGAAGTPRGLPYGNVFGQQEGGLSFLSRPAGSGSLLSSSYGSDSDSPYVGGPYGGALMNGYGSAGGDEYIGDRGGAWIDPITQFPTLIPPERIHRPEMEVTEPTLAIPGESWREGGSAGGGGEEVPLGEVKDVSMMRSVPVFGYGGGEGRRTMYGGMGKENAGGNFERENPPSGAWMNNGGVSGSNCFGAGCTDRVPVPPAIDDGGYLGGGGAYEFPMVEEAEAFSGGSGAGLQQGNTFSGGGLMGNPGAIYPMQGSVSPFGSGIPLGNSYVGGEGAGMFGMGGSPGGVDESPEESDDDFGPHSGGMGAPGSPWMPPGAPGDTNFAGDGNEQQRYTEYLESINQKYGIGMPPGNSPNSNFQQQLSRNSFNGKMAPLGGERGPVPGMPQGRGGMGLVPEYNQKMIGRGQQAMGPEGGMSPPSSAFNGMVTGGGVLPSGQLPFTPLPRSFQTSCHSAQSGHAPYGAGGGCPFNNNNVAGGNVPGALSKSKTQAGENSLTGGDSGQSGSPAGRVFGVIGGSGQPEVTRHEGAGKESDDGPRAQQRQGTGQNLYGSSSFLNRLLRGNSQGDFWPPSAQGSSLSGLISPSANNAAGAFATQPPMASLPVRSQTEAAIGRSADIVDSVQQQQQLLLEQSLLLALLTSSVPPGAPFQQSSPTTVTIALPASPTTTTTTQQPLTTTAATTPPTPTTTTTTIEDEQRTPMQPSTTSVQALTQQIRRLPAVLYVDSRKAESRRLETLLRDNYGLPLVTFYVDKIDRPERVETNLEQLTAHRGMPYLFICGTFIGSLEHIQSYHEQRQIPQLVEYVCSGEVDKGKKLSSEIEQHQNENEFVEESMKKRATGGRGIRKKKRTTERRKERRKSRRKQIRRKERNAVRTTL